MLTFAFPRLLQGEEKSAFPYAWVRQTLSSTHCPSHSLLHCGTPSPPVLTRWLPEHLFTLGDGPRCRVCPSASPFRPVGFPHSFASLLAGVPVEAPLLRCREDNTSFNTPSPPIRKSLQKKSRTLSPFAFPLPTHLFFCIVLMC